jgi:hypothetical protein
MSVALRIFMCVIAVAIAGEACAQSQRRSRANPPSTQTTQPTAPEQRGTDQVPFTVKILPTPDAKENADKEERERREKAEIDRKLAFETQRIADYTFYLGLFTVALFCAALGQIVLFWIQLKLIRSETKKARISLNIARRSANASGQAAEAARVAVEHIPKVERAYLHIVIVDETISRAAGILAANQDKLSGDGHLESMKPNVRYVFKNYGKTPALVKEISHTITHAPSLPDDIDYIPVDIVLNETFVATGDSTQELRCTFTDTLSTQHAAEIVRGQRTYWFHGQIVYDDIFGDEQVHRFVWKYSGGSHGFRPVQHPKYSKNT